MAIKKLKIEDLNKLYMDGETADREVYAEMRSNILLVAGEHYTKKAKQFFSTLRENVGSDSKDDNKIRITKNHTQRAVKLIVNSLLSAMPGVTIQPNNPKEIQDIKAAELHKSIWEFAKKKYDLTKKKQDTAQDFVTVGECAIKLFFDPFKGRHIGYEQKMDEMGQPLFDADGQPISSEKAVFSGDFVFERIFGFNLFRAKSAQSWDDSWFIGVRKLVDKKELLYRYSEDSEKKKAVEGSSGEAFIVFDAGTSSYKMDEQNVLLKEYYIKPCPDYPNGYFFITTTAGILEEGELPFGVMPIVVETFEEYQTSPRGRSPIKHGRPVQAEINRKASKAAEHQISIGDDKLVLYNNSKVTQGSQLPGVRTVHVSGQPPMVIQGRSGEQFSQSLNEDIDEFYQLMMVAEEAAPKQEAQVDPYALLYKNMRQKKEFSVFSGKFERFWRKLCELYLTLAREYLDEQEIIPVIGKQEYVNISEFKNSRPIGYEISIEPSSEDLDTMLGKQLIFNNILQFVGSNMERDDLGKLLKGMPMLNAEDTFSDYTIDYENAMNDILALDRGEMPQIRPGVNFAYTLKRITARMKQSDFTTTLQPQIQQMYMMYQQQLEQAVAQEQEQIRAGNADLIPAQGFLTPCDFYVPAADGSGKTQRARLPIDSLSWLVQRLEQQGVSLKQLEQLQTTAQAGVAGAITQNQAMNQGAQAQGSTGEMFGQQ